MQSKQKISFVILGIMIGLVTGILILKSHTTKYEIGKIKMRYTIDSLRSEIFYLEVFNSLNNARSLEDLLLTGEIFSSEFGSEEKSEAFKYRFIENFYPDLRKMCYKKSEEIYFHELLKQSSREEWEEIQKNYVSLRSMGIAHS